MKSQCSNLQNHCVRTDRRIWLHPPS